MFRERNTDWTSKLDTFGKAVLEMLGYEYLPSDRNLITDALAQDAEGFVAQCETLPDYSKAAMCRAVVVFQMPLYDRIQGPDEDSKPKGLRRHWYHYFKVKFAQKYGAVLGEADDDGDVDNRRWSQIQSQTYGHLVDRVDVTYLDLWVKDDSRHPHVNYTQLFENANIMLAVEKASLLNDYKEVGERIGAKVVFSGDGQPSKANIEKILMDVFNWAPSHYEWQYNYQTGQDEHVWVPEPFEDNPLVILHISDHDFAGEEVIGPTFAEQARRYTHNIIEARVGIKPAQVAVEDQMTEWFVHKQSHTGYQKWTQTKGLWKATCSVCGTEFPVVGIKDEYGDITHWCPECGGNAQAIVPKDDRAYGFEVEALKTWEYDQYIVEALLECIPYDVIVKNLRRDCKADPWIAAQNASRELANKNQGFVELEEEIRRLEEVRNEFFNTIAEGLQTQGSPRVSDWENDPWKPYEQEPPQDEFINHVVKKGYGTWRPFRQDDRTAKLQKWMLDQADHDEIENAVIEW